jgi:hypothetical protein
LLIIAGELELIIAKYIWQFGYVILLNARWQFCNSLSLNICWQFRQPLIAQTETIELVTFIGLGGVNDDFSHVTLILVATSIIFEKITTY